VRKNAQLILGLVVSLLALALAFRGADLGAMASALRKANYFVLVPDVGLFLLGLVFRAMSWNVILGGQVPYWRVFEVLNEGYLLNDLLPFRLGEFGRAYLISRRNNLPALEALSSIVVERVIDLLMVVVLLVAFLPLVAGLGTGGARDAAFSSIGLGLAAVIGLVLVARNQTPLSRLVGRVLRRLNWRWLDPDRWEARAGSFLAGLSALRDPRRALQAAFWSGLAWAAAGLGAWVLLLAFMPGASVTMAFVTLTMVGIGAAVPSAPGSAGVFEFVVVQSLSIFGVDKSLALSYGLALHAANVVLAIVLGGLALAREGETLAHLARAAQSLVSSRQPAETPEPAAPKQ
jgi:glycosyltransferase 2 family protein